mmetsp:Transcript_37835/g.80807  ORF Transcript_37835/g.80807 Transcript_37835/m.80807 type:complete len:340 (-) Transcript_37835:355-1374(-)
MERGVRDRRAEEIEALQAYYGNDLRRSLRDVRSMSPTSTSPPPKSESEAFDIPLEGPWFLRIRQTNMEDDGSGDINFSLGTPTLEIRLPPCYPLGEARPEPILHNVMMNPQLKQQLLRELTEMYEAEIDVGILWGERCREELSFGELTGVNEDADEYNANSNQGTASLMKSDGDNSKGIRTFIPPTTRYSQPIRHFPVDVITNSKYQRMMVHTLPFHPPKSGPSEIMIAHVCTVTCIEHVQWALAELLFNDKKVSKATHNMFAYRFTSDGSHFSDNDDDGEKGSGSKLASLLDMCHVENVLVVVSRWFGGSLLGPARFKWIAGVAKDGLVQGGFLAENK